MGGQLFSLGDQIIPSEVKRVDVIGKGLFPTAIIGISRSATRKLVARNREKAPPPPSIGLSKLVETGLLGYVR
jgi:hypothetical protein